MLARVLDLRSVAVSSAVLLALLAAACGGGSKEVVIDVKIENRALTPGTISVKENAKVTLKIQTDERGVFRVSEYNVSADIEPGKVAELYFAAFPKTLMFSSTKVGGLHSIMFQPEGRPDEQQIGTLLVEQK